MKKNIKITCKYFEDFVVNETARRNRIFTAYIHVLYKEANFFKKRVLVSLFNKIKIQSFYVNFVLKFLFQKLLIIGASKGPFPM